MLPRALQLLSLMELAEGVIKVVVARTIGSKVFVNPPFLSSLQFAAGMCLSRIAMTASHFHFSLPLYDCICGTAGGNHSIFCPCAALFTSTLERCLTSICEGAGLPLPPYPQAASSSSSSSPSCSRVPRSYFPVPKRRRMHEDPANPVGSARVLCPATRRGQQCSCKV